MGNIYSRIFPSLTLPSGHRPENVKALPNEKVGQLKEKLSKCNNNNKKGLKKEVVVIVTPDDNSFNEFRNVWNLDTAGWPCVITRPNTAEEVSVLLQFAREESLDICVRSGGAHSQSALVDNAFAIDMSNFRNVTVDPETKTATVGGGATIGDVDSVCKPYNLALPMGQVHHTGVAGMALNATSGIGYLSRTRGLNVQFLKSVDVVLATGEIITNLNAETNPDLFWAMKGAGSNFGIITKLVYNLTEITPTVYSGTVVKFPKGEGPPIWNTGMDRIDIISNHIKHFEDNSNKDTLNELSALFIIAGRGPIVAELAYIPQEADNDKPPSEIFHEASIAMKPIRDYGKSLVDTVKPINFWDGLQKMATFPPSYYYQKAIFLKSAPSEEMLMELCNLAKECPVSNQGTAIIIQPLGGKLSTLQYEEVPSAPPMITSRYWVLIIANYPKGDADPDLRKRCIEWVKSCYCVLKPQGNFFQKDLSSTTTNNSNNRLEWDEKYGELYWENEEKLRNLKQKYDPDNIFHLNRNISPNKSLLKSVV